jgi:uncharacterized integral membrane protein
MTTTPGPAERDSSTTSEGPTEPDTRVEYRGAGVMWGAIALFVTLVLLIVLVFQNTHDVAYEVFWVDAEAPLALIIVIVVALTVVASEAIGLVWRRRSRARRREHDELQRLRRQS